MERHDELTVARNCHRVIQSRRSIWVWKHLTFSRRHCRLPECAEPAESFAHNVGIIADSALGDNPRCTGFTRKKKKKEKKKEIHEASAKRAKIFRGSDYISKSMCGEIHQHDQTDVHHPIPDPRSLRPHDNITFARPECCALTVCCRQASWLTRLIRREGLLTASITSIGFPHSQCSCVDQDRPSWNQPFSTSHDRICA